MTQVRAWAALGVAAVFLSVSADAGAQAPTPPVPPRPNPSIPPPPTPGPPPPPPAALPPNVPPPPLPVPAIAPAAPAPAAQPPAVAPPKSSTGPVAPAAGPTPPTPPPPEPKPAPELEKLKPLEGAWRCEGKMPAGPFGPEQTYKATFRIKKDMDDFWYALDYEQKKSKQHPSPIKGRGFLGFDGATKRFVVSHVDNGGGIVLETSAGWEGDKLVFAGDASMLGQKMPLRETYTKKSEREMIWLGEAKMGKDWIVLGNDTCRR